MMQLKMNSSLQQSSVVGFILSAYPSSLPLTSPSQSALRFVDDTAESHLVHLYTWYTWYTCTRGTRGTPAQLTCVWCAVPAVSKHSSLVRFSKHLSSGGPHGHCFELLSRSARKAHTNIHSLSLFLTFIQTHMHAHIALIAVAWVVCLFACTCGWWVDV